MLSLLALSVFSLIGASQVQSLTVMNATFFWGCSCTSTSWGTRSIDFAGGEIAKGPFTGFSIHAIRDYEVLAFDWQFVPDSKYYVKALSYYGNETATFMLGLKGDSTGIGEGCYTFTNSSTIWYYGKSRTASCSVEITNG